MTNQKNDALEFGKYAMAVIDERLVSADLPLTEKRQRMIVRGAIANALDDWLADKNVLPGLLHNGD